MSFRVIRRRLCSPLADFARHLNPVLRRVYAARGLSADGELSLGLDGLLPVGSLDEIEEAVGLLKRHYECGSRVLVIGDFDADGATSCALVVRCLRKLG